MSAPFREARGCWWTSAARAGLSRENWSAACSLSAEKWPTVGPVYQANRQNAYKITQPTSGDGMPQ